MHRLLLSLAALGLLISAPAISKPPKVVHKTIVEGITYKVQVRGNEASVKSLKFMDVPKGPHWRRAKIAAEQATGCTVSESYTVEGTLYVVLDCANRENVPSL